MLNFKQQSTKGDLNFVITGKDIISTAFLKLKIPDFSRAMHYIKNLPYGKLKDKMNLESVLTEGKGTCSTKHAILYALAKQHGIENIKLMMCSYRMSKINTPEIGAILDSYNIDFIIEAHNYLKFGDDIVDCTEPNSSYLDFANDLIDEIEIMPRQIGSFKNNFIKHATLKYCAYNQIQHLDRLLGIREICLKQF